MKPFDHSEEDTIRNVLQKAAQMIEPGSAFTEQLEKQLKENHIPRPAFNLARLVAPMGWALALIALAFVFNWIASQIAPKNVPASNQPFLCPVTQPNGSLPPGETVEDENYFGNDGLWTALWPDGKVFLTASDRQPDGTFSMKWPWWRAVPGTLTITGHRLDEKAEPLRAEIPEGYGDSGFQSSGLIFPTTGCWEITGMAGDSSLTLVTEVLLDLQELQPAPLETAATPITAIATVSGRVYEWNGQPVHLDAEFPESPAEMKIYLPKNEIPATVQDVQALGRKFGMAGEIYQVQAEVAGTANYLMVDGNKQLYVRSDRYFIYDPDYTQTMEAFNTEEYPNPKTLIDEFMQKYGLGNEYKIEPSELYGEYFVQLLTPDGFTVHQEHFSSSGYIFDFNATGILRVQSSLLNYDEISTAGIINAEEALTKFLDPARIYGSVFAMHPPIPRTFSWIRDHPLDQTLTYYGFLTSTARSVSGAAAYIRLDGYPVTGNVRGIPENMPNTFVVATGQFHEANGIKTFELETWKLRDGYEEGFQGAIQQEGGQAVFISTEGKQLSIVDVPNDLPLPAENVFITGISQEGELVWKTISTGFMGGGGGGGGDSGFYRLNLSGTPMPLPTPIPTPRPPILEAHQFEKQRGILGVTITNQNDGSQRIQYWLAANDPNYPYVLLEGENMESLEAYNNRPIDIWGIVDRFDEQGNIVVNVDRFEIPFPDLHFEILKGSEKLVEIEGNPTLLFTEDGGPSYVQLAPNCYDRVGAESAMGSGEIGQTILVEALIIPDQTLGSYSTVCIFSKTIATNPANGEPVELTITADQPYLTDESIPSGTNPPTMSIEKVELVYFTPDMRYQPTQDPDSEPAYLQPVWRFSGHYSDGSEFEILVQALKDEFLSPQLREESSP